MTSQFDYIHPVPYGHQQIVAQRERMLHNLRHYEPERRSLLFQSGCEYWELGDDSIVQELNAALQGAVTAGDDETAEQCRQDLMALLIRPKG